MNPAEVIAYSFIGGYAIYVAARLITAAYFKSKQQHEQRKIP
jgi:hypothetical protein